MDTDANVLHVLYGRPGTGKTTMLGSYPKPLLIIDVRDRGTESAKTKDLKRGDVTVARVKDFDDVWKVYDMIVDDPSRFKTVGLDHITALQNLVFEKIMNDKGTNFMHQNYYQESSAMMREFIMSFIDIGDLGIQPVILSQQKIHEVEFNGDTEDEEIDPEVSLELQPAVAKMVMTNARVLAQTHIQQRREGKKVTAMEYRLRLGASPVYVTKVTQPKGSKCPKHIVNPTYDKLKKVIDGEWVDENKPKKKKKKGSSK